MPDGLEPAVGASSRHARGIPRIALIGSLISFSDRLLWILQDEFPSFQFERDVDATFGGMFQANGLHLLICDEDAVSKVLGSPLCDQVHVAVAYKDVSSVANRLAKLGIRELPANLSLLPMNVQIDTWLSIVKLLLCGETYVPVSVLPLLSDLELCRAPPGRTYAGAEITERMTEAPSGSGVCLSKLTEREREVLPLIAEGKQNKVIAEELKMSEHTLKLHVHHIIAKLGVRNRTEATSRYLSLRSSQEAARR